ncbi:MAG: ribulose-phosphate 3-epimerase [Rickettsiales bacterium]
MTVLISPSLLACDFSRLGEECERAERAGADWLHVDVMDGRFVPNVTVGPCVVAAVKSRATVPLDVHLMIEEPERHVDAFADAGSDYITVHAEACRHLDACLKRIRALGKKAGVSLNPSTPENVLEYVLRDVDLILLMTVNPGFGGQRFLDGQAEKIRRVRRMIDVSGSAALLSADGGINADTAPIAVKAGCDVLVAGSAVFCKTGDTAIYAKNIQKLKGIV